MNQRALAEKICLICRQAYDAGFITSTDGNVSARLGRDRLLITPSGVYKGFMKPEDICVADMQGQKISGRHGITSEVMLHLLVYRERPDINAVVHAHPPYATAMSLAGISLAEGLMPEMVLSLGSVPTAPYGTPGTAELAQSIRPYLQNYTAIILKRHGSLTVGENLDDAFFRLERLEYTAKVTHAAISIGAVSPLSGEELSRLGETARRLGISEQALRGAVQSAGTPPSVASRSRCNPSWPDRESLREAITRELLEELG